MIIAKKMEFRGYFHKFVNWISMYGNSFIVFTKYPGKIAFLSYNHSYEINSISLWIAMVQYSVRDLFGAKYFTHST